MRKTATIPASSLACSFVSSYVVIYSSSLPPFLFFITQSLFLSFQVCYVRHRCVTIPLCVRRLALPRLSGPLRGRKRGRHHGVFELFMDWKWWSPCTGSWTMLERSRAQGAFTSLTSVSNILVLISLNNLVWAAKWETED